MLPNKSSAITRRLAAVAAMMVLFVVAAAPTVHRALAAKKDIEDFAPTYLAARAMWNGQDISEATDRLYPYSPFVAFLFQPVAALPKYGAAVVWTALSAALIAAALIIASRQVVRRWRLDSREPDVSLPWLIAAIALLLSFEKLHAEFRLIQIDALMILGFASILIWLDRKPSLAGVLVGITANIKYLGLIFVPYFITKRNYRAAAVSIASFIFFMMLPAVEIGPHLAGHYAANALGGLAKLTNLTPRVPGQGLKVDSLSWDRSISFTSALFRVTNSYGLSDSIAVALVVGALAAIIGTIVSVGRRHGLHLFSPDASNHSASRDATASLEWTALIAIALVFSPQTMGRHMMLLSLVYTVAIGIFVAHKERQSRALLLAAVVVAALGLSLPSRSLGVHDLLRNWRAISGASGCAFLLILAVTSAGSKAISKMANKEQQQLS
jgi:hypothetical protein